MPEPKDILRHLERRLSTLERAGMRWLNVPAPPDPVHPPATVHLTAEPPPVAASGEDRAATASAAPASGAAPREGSADAPLHPAECGTLSELAQQYRDCTRCKLSGTRTNLVFGVGTEHPRVMFVGEGPGADEDAQGEPFVGRAGALLTGLIQAMGLVREDVYITNVVKCRPPGNRNPEPDEIAACRPILQRQVELLRPRLIVTLGNVPLKVLKPEAAGITRERGRLFTYREWDVLPTFHPSYLLRNPAAIETCWEDFRKALRTAYSDA